MTYSVTDISHFSGFDVHFPFCWASWQCLFCLFLNSLGFSEFVFVLTWLTSKIFLSSDPVECGKPQIRSLKHKVFQTLSYLSHIWCNTDNTRNQGHIDVLDKYACLNYWYGLQPAFFHFCWDILVICLTLVLKFAVTALTSLYFRTLWPNWLNFVFNFKNTVHDRKLTENNLASSWSSGTRWRKCRATFAIELGSLVRSWAAK